MEDAIPLVVYLDQNAWIALARAVKKPSIYPDIRHLLGELISQVEAKALVVPLSFTNIYETHKINDPARRELLASVQCTVSKGLVFRGRMTTLRKQIRQFLAKSHAIALPNSPPLWFLSQLHFESVTDYDPDLFGVSISDRLMAAMCANPAAFLFDYLTQLDEPTRKAAVQKFSEASAELLRQLEERRMRVSSETLAMRRRIYAAQLMIEHMALIVSVGRELGLTFSSWEELGEARARALPRQVPTFNIEWELAIRTEAESRPIVENDLRDISAFYTVLPYADVLVAERAFINRARQAGLGEAYNTYLLTDLTALPEALGRRNVKPKTRQL